MYREQATFMGGRFCRKTFLRPKKQLDTFIRNSPEASTGADCYLDSFLTVQLFLYPLKRARGIFLGVLCQLF